jgi:tRNA (guanine37-N1)-methyltransferase
MIIDVLTLFPAMFQGPLTESILQRAQEQGLLAIALHDLRECGVGRHRQVDDTPYGGGAGMVFRCDIVVQAIEEVMLSSGEKNPNSQNPIPKQFPKPNPQTSILLSARGERLTQEKVEELAKCDRLLLVCGHYEGVDQRVVDGGWIDEEISIGDYVLTGGELPAMVLIDAVARQLPGVLGADESSAEESFSKKLERKREYPHFTRPEEFRGLRVPEVLLSGNHAEIEKWRRERLR